MSSKSPAPSNPLLQNKERNDLFPENRCNKCMRSTFCVWSKAKIIIVILCVLMLSGGITAIVLYEQSKSPLLCVGNCAITQFETCESSISIGSMNLESNKWDNFGWTSCAEYFWDGSWPIQFRMGKTCNESCNTKEALYYNQYTFDQGECINVDWCVTPEFMCRRHRYNDNCNDYTQKALNTINS